MHEGVKVASGGGSLEVVAMPLVCACGVFGGKICGSVSGE